MMRSTTSLLVLSTLALTLGGCLVQLPGNLDAGGEGEESSGESGDTAESSASGMTTDESDTDEPPTDTGDGQVGIDGDGCQARLDILVVVDNSGSMSVLQRRFAESIGALIDPLDEAGVDWRLGVTTTDVGNPWCPPGQTTPEHGSLQLRACNDHLEDFLFNNGELDVTETACTDICPYGPGKLFTLATTTDLDPNPAPRPWLERTDGESNLPGDLDAAVAARCLVPQGVNGCGFEQPLESMRLALERATMPGEPEHGFMRDDASLLVLIVSDEVDCSHTPHGEAIFDIEGERSFWSDPTAALPSSAVCWNAGVRCTGDPSGFDSCVAQDYDLSGQPSDAEQAVLLPVSTYHSLLEDIELAKRELDPGADVGMLVLGGVGLGGELHYAEVGDSDPEFQLSFGIGPGCTAAEPLSPTGETTALPIVRMRELAEGLSSDAIGSACAPDFSASFEGVLERLLGACD